LTAEGLTAFFTFPGLFFDRDEGYNPEIWGHRSDKGPNCE
jgi:hypothetical protein